MNLLLSLTLECARPAQPASLGQPLRPDSNGARDCRPSCPICRAPSSLGQASHESTGWVTAETCKSRPIGGTSSDCGFFSSGRGWQADGKWQPYRRRVMQRSNPDYRATGLEG